MLLVVLAAVCLASVPACGGDLRRLGAVKVNLATAAGVALVLQVVVTEVWTSGSAAVHGAVQLASYALAGVFVAANLSIPGIGAMALGGALNLAAISANGGVMPASRWALARSGLAIGRGFSNSAPLTHPHLLWLGDVIPVPAGPLANVLSAGDLLIFAGLLFLLHRSCGRLRSGRRRARGRSLRRHSNPPAVGDAPGICWDSRGPWNAFLDEVSPGPALGASTPPGAGGVWPEREAPVATGRLVRAPGVLRRAHARGLERGAGGSGPPRSPDAPRTAQTGGPTPG
jgi:Family of unknown function (DUF5317)